MLLLLSDKHILNNNALSSASLASAWSPWGLEIRFVVKGAGAVMLLFRFEYKVSVICHNVNTQNVAIARSRQAAHPA